MIHYPAIVVIAALVGALVAGILSFVQERYTYPAALIATGVSCAAAVRDLIYVAGHGPIAYHMAGWAPPMGIEYRIDTLNAMVLVLITAIAFLNLAASWPNVKQEMPDRSPSFYVMYLLFVVGLTGVASTGDLFNLYVLIEITSLSSYTMIALGDRDRGPISALNYVFVGVIGPRSIF